MSIQHVASSGTSGIMGFLFQDDGGMDGTVPEGAEFAKTLHQLLGEYAGEAPQTTPQALADVISDTDVEPAQSGAPLSGELDALAGDFAPPAHGAELPHEAGSDDDADGEQNEHPFWGIAPFNELPAALHDAAAAPTTNADALAAATKKPDTNKNPTPAPAFGSGIQHLIELARDAEQAVTQLTQPSPIPAPVPTPAPGRSAPMSGKVLPQAFRSLASSMSMITAGTQARAEQAGFVKDALPAANESSFNASFSSLIAEATNEPRNQQNAPASSPVVTQTLQGLRNESALPAQKAAADTAMSTPQFESQHIAGTQAWFEDLGTRVEWLKDMNIEKAELQLHPAELGLLEIHIATGDDGASVSFVTHNAEARALIEDSMPKLRELLANQGMQLGDSQVSQHSAGEQCERELGSGPHAQPAENDEQQSTRRTVYIADPNRVDHYV